MRGASKGRAAAEAAPERITVDNRQRRVEVDTARVAALISDFAKDARLPAAAEIECVFLPEPRMRALNLEWRGIDRSTDVLSFPFGGPDEGAGGSIAIAPATLLPEAVRGDLSFAVAERLVHGVLHLAGHDHPEETFDGTPMGRLQARLLAKAPPSRLARLARVAKPREAGGR